MTHVSVFCEVDSMDEVRKAVEQYANVPNLSCLHFDFRKSDSDSLCAPEAEPVAQPAPPKEPEPVFTMQEVRAALLKIRESAGVDGMREHLRKYGVEKLADLAPEHYSAIMKDIEHAS